MLGISYYLLAEDNQKIKDLLRNARRVIEFNIYIKFLAFSTFDICK